jgi:hypothetical protein
MGKTLRKYRKNRTYDPVPSAETASPYAVHDGKGTRHVDSDLLSSPHEFVPLDKLAPGHASPQQIFFTMMATSVGTMAIALPYAMLEGGFVMCIFMILFVGLVTHATRTRLIELGVEQGIYSFQGLAKLAFGAVGGYAVSVTQLGLSLGLIIGYLLIVFQDIPIVLGHWFKMDFDSNGRPIVTPKKRVSPLLHLLADRYWFPEALVSFVFPSIFLLSNVCIIFIVLIGDARRATVLSVRQLVRTVACVTSVCVQRRHRCGLQCCRKGEGRPQYQCYHPFAGLRSRLPQSASDRLPSVCDHRNVLREPTPQLPHVLRHARSVPR